jgi:acetyl esterase/lipase
MSRFTPVASFVLLLFAGSILTAGEIKIEEKIVYGKGGDVDLQLDLARPDGEGPFPAVVFIHGGGWQGGDRKMYRDDIEEFAKRGYVAATVTYRLVNTKKPEKERVIFPAQINDVKCAVRFLRANAKRYHLDPNRIGATGGSAGGHLVLMLGTTDTSAMLEGDGGNPDVSSRVQAVVNYFGPTDFPYWYTSTEKIKPIAAAFLGGTPEQKANEYKQVSPITYLSKDDPPTLTIQGTIDPLVPLDQATRFDDAAKKVGVDHTVLVMEGQGHGFKGEAGKKAKAATVEFFDKHLKGAK